MKAIYILYFLFVFSSAFGQQAVDTSIFEIDIPYKISDGREPRLIAFKNNSFAVTFADGEFPRKNTLIIQHYSNDFNLLKESKIDITGYEINGGYSDENNRIYFFCQNKLLTKTIYYDAETKEFTEDQFDWDPNSSTDLDFFTQTNRGWVACSQLWKPVMFGNKKGGKIKGINFFDFENKTLTTLPVDIDGQDQKDVTCMSLTYMKQSNVIIAAISIRQGMLTGDEHILIYDTQGKLLKDHFLYLDPNMLQLSYHFVEKGPNEFFLIGICTYRDSEQLSIFNVPFSVDRISDMEFEIADDVLDNTCYGEAWENNFNKAAKREYPALETQFTFHDAIPTKDGFYLILEKTYPIYTWVTDPKTGRQTRKRVGYNSDATFVLKFDQNADLVWNNCFDMSLDYTPKYLSKHAAYTVDNNEKVQLCYIGIGDLVYKSFDAKGEAALPVLESKFFKKQYLFDTQTYQEKSRVYHLNDNIFIGCHVLKSSIELKKIGI